MKIVVIGGTGLIGSKVVACLNEEDSRPRAPRPPTPASTRSQARDSTRCSTVPRW